MSDTIIKIDHVSKEYRLGMIGGGTLRGDLQTLAARLLHKTDPNAKIGKEQDGYQKNQKFLALDEVSFEVKKGDTLGVIGHNGAGKSTLLKLLSRVTAPTRGSISYNGRIASMLEVGTGFHPELTGRENVYLNGAILGMTKAEISRKFDEIVEFAEMEKFIDTPVKRYSSGMYVKLAFAVAAHLDSEILVMDEVLAVGDAKFQQKCLGKMGDVASTQGRTVLYVSHNMNTIRQLCNRCVVLDHGRLVYDGEVDEAIQLYMEASEEMRTVVNLEEKERPTSLIALPKVRMKELALVDKKDVFFDNDEPMRIRIKWTAEEDIENVEVRMIFSYIDTTRVGLAVGEKPISAKKGETHQTTLKADISAFASGKYYASIFFFKKNVVGGMENYDGINRAFYFEIKNENTNMIWYHSSWGHVSLPELGIADLTEE